ncbi:energy transducer TonB [Wenzhouxiangella sediminis]|uniref:Protein TonB n=1 Tax=Wenzhouxiangella sediminis TaxID=1792836 RepID=A0A3E1KAV8_9GAMM|nr:energy transducer TonB [Wenzhouxiangella sediminis]RFF31551.1 energy transducer TonB [Wenzhouxiangella sediminis]
MTSEFKKWTYGLAFMFAGSVLIIGTLLMINRLASGPDSQELAKQTSFSVEKRPEPPPRKVVKQERPEPRRSRDINPPMVDLDTSLSGIDMGIPGVSADDLGSLRDELLGDTQDVVMTDDSVDQPPRPTRQTPLPYPASARKQGVEGYVVLSLLISAAGEIEKVQVLESNPVGLFEDAAVQGVQNWRFDPAQYQGRNVRVWAKQRIRFDLS